HFERSGGSDVAIDRVDIGAAPAPTEVPATSSPTPTATPVPPTLVATATPLPATPTTYVPVPSPTATVTRSPSPLAATATVTVSVVVTPTRTLRRSSLPAACRLGKGATRAAAPHAACITGRRGTGSTTRHVALTVTAPRRVIRQGDIERLDVRAVPGARLAVRVVAAGTNRTEQVGIHVRQGRHGR